MGSVSEGRGEGQDGISGGEDKERRPTEGGIEKAEGVLRRSALGGHRALTGSGWAVETEEGLGGRPGEP